MATINKLYILKRYTWNDHLYVRVQFLKGRIEEIKLAKGFKENPDKWKKLIKDYEMILESISEPAICPCCGRPY